MNTQQYLRALRKACRARGVVSPRLIGEAAEYLQDMRDEELARGVSLADAESAAIQRFGRVEDVVDGFVRRTVVVVSPADTPGAAPRRPRGPGFAYGVLAVVLVAVLGTVASTSRQAAPPTIAEFAPQAVDRIVESAEGSAGADGGTRQGASPPEASAAAREQARAAVDVARVRQCVGDPPRQIEDPQSPPCVPYWSGDNGGGTWKGVTRDEIRVAWAFARGNDAVALEAFFNKRFEFYGRQIRLIAGCGMASEPTRMRAAALCVSEQTKAFAAADHVSNGGHSYFLELGRRGVVAASHMPNLDERDTTEFRPYLWQYASSADQIFASLGRWACGRLAGRRAAHAGDPFMAARERRFGIVMQHWHPDSRTTSAALETELERCGVRPAAKIGYCFCDGYVENAADPRPAINAVTQLKAAGVTSVLCLCVVMDIGKLPRAATSQGWFPEWLISTYHIQDSVEFVRDFWSVPREHLAHTFGLRFMPKSMRWQDNPAAWALHEIDPSYPEPRGIVARYILMAKYRSLLLLASGIQMAGPHLTPETFERGLVQTRFPNPDHTNMAGAVGFRTPAGGSDYSKTDDAAEIWWSNEAEGGAYCYVGGGVRHGLSSWPSDPGRFFEGPCDPGGASE